MSRRAVTRLVVGISWLLATPGLARAQAAAPAAGRGFELTLGGSWEAPMAVGSATANFLNNSGGDFAQFRTSSGLGQGFGLEANLGFALTRRLYADAIGGWTRISLTTDVFDDFEGAADVTVSEPASRFLAGGAVRLLLSAPKRMTWFVRGGVMWMREAAGGNTLAANGVMSTAGGGVDYIWRDTPSGGVRRLGLRIDGRVNFRSDGLSLGNATLRVGPAVAALLIMGFR